MTIMTYTFELKSKAPGRATSGTAKPVEWKPLINKPHSPHYSLHKVELEMLPILQNYFARENNRNVQKFDTIAKNQRNPRCKTNEFLLYKL